jgi:hypothetical protein
MNLKTIAVSLAFVLCGSLSILAQNPPAPPPAAPDYSPSTWKEYSYPVHDFKIRLPKSPVFASKTGDGKTSPNATHSYTHKSFLQLAVEIWEYPPVVNFETLPEKELLDKMQAGGMAAIADLQPKLINQSDMKVGTRTARFFHVETNNGEVLRGFFLIKKNRIYYLYGSVLKGRPHGLNHENNFEKPVMAFLNSFQLLNEN